MKLFKEKITNKDLLELEKEFGGYFKVTVDIENKWLVAGCELHSDGEDILVGEGSHPRDIWGGAVDLKVKSVETLAVLNLRASQGNASMDILDPVIREKLIKVVKEVIWNQK